MSESLKFKAETAVSSFLEVEAHADLADYTFCIGQSPLSQNPPCVVVSVAGIVESFPEAMPKDVSLTIEIVSPIDTDADADGIQSETSDRTAAWTAHRYAVAAVEERLQDLTSLQAYVNKVNVTDRPVSDFYVYDIQEDNQSSVYAGDERVMVSTVMVTLVCEAQDN